MHFDLAFIIILKTYLSISLSSLPIDKVFSDGRKNWVANVSESKYIICLFSLEGFLYKRKGSGWVEEQKVSADYQEHNAYEDACI